MILIFNENPWLRFMAGGEYLPSAEEFRASAGVNPVVCRKMDDSLGHLATLARNNAPKPTYHSGVVRPKEVHVTRRFDGREIVVAEVGVCAVRLMPAEIQVYMLGGSVQETTATLVGAVPSGCESDEGFLASGVYPLGLSAEVCRYALGMYYFRNTDDYFD